VEAVLSLCIFLMKVENFHFRLTTMLWRMWREWRLYWAESSRAF